MEVDQKKTGGDIKVECKLRSGGDMPTPRVELGGVSLGILNSDVNFWAQILFSLFTIFIKERL